MATQTATPKKDTRIDVYDIVTGRIMDHLQKGIVPWRVPWTDAGIPQNLISKRAYRGVNSMLLACLGYERNLFVTSKQLKELGASIKPEEKPHVLIYWNVAEKGHEGSEKETAGKRNGPFLRYYTVYNIGQCMGIPPELIPEVAKEATPGAACERIVSGLLNGPAIRHKDPEAYYDCLEDYVNVAKIKSFDNEGHYYSALFHQLVHSTGHHSRLDRMGLVQMPEFGCEPYTMEELTAEIGTSFLQSLTGITGTFFQSAEYIPEWIAKLRSDKYFIVTAATQAQKATDFILNVQAEEKEHVES